MKRMLKRIMLKKMSMLMHQL